MKKYRTISKKYCIFALCIAKHNFLILLCVVFLFTTTLKAENNRQPISGYCTKVSVIVFRKDKKGCLSLYSKFNNKNFLFMRNTTKNADGAKYSNPLHTETTAGTDLLPCGKDKCPLNLQHLQFLTELKQMRQTFSTPTYEKVGYALQDDVLTNLNSTANSIGDIISFEINEACYYQDEKGGAV